MSAQSLQEVLQRAADILTGGQSCDDVEVADILNALEYGPSTRVGAEHDIANAAALLRSAARLNRLFQLQAPDAPGLTFFGAEVEHAGEDGHHARGSASGAGLTARSAFESCVGEAIEFLSQFEQGDSLTQLPAGAPPPNAPDEFRSLDQPPGSRNPPSLAWIAGRRLSDGTEVVLPADLCLRRAPPKRAIEPPMPMSVGCAAGRSREAAMLHGLLELVERDAFALWWLGGSRGRLLREEDHDGAQGGLLRQIRSAGSERHTWVLDITSDLEVPCIVALSANRAGREIACGCAARLSTAQAVHRAVLEMCQMELAYRIVDLKLAEGGELNERDRGLQHRRHELDAAHASALHPYGTPSAARVHPVASDEAALVALTKTLSAAGIEVYSVDLTRRRFGVPVARLLAPKLQPYPSPVVTGRLAATVAATGGSDPYTREVPLM